MSWIRPGTGERLWQWQGALQAEEEGICSRPCMAAVTKASACPLRACQLCSHSLYGKSHRALAMMAG